MGYCCKPDSKLECAKVDRPVIENRELALSYGKRGTSRSKKLNLESGVYTELGRYLFQGFERKPQSRPAIKEAD